MTETLETRRPLFLRLIHKMAEGRPYYLIENTDGSPYLCRILIRGYLPKVHGIYGKTASNEEIRKAHDLIDRNPIRILGIPFYLNLYLHRFFREDQDRDIHSHPWKWSFALPIWGGYIEEKRNRRTGKTFIRRVWPGMINRLGARDFHRILSLLGTESWSLFAAGGKASAWGFLVAGLFIAARDYLRAKGYIDEGPSASKLPDWLMVCACCGGHFPPPGNYYVRTEKTETGRRGVRAPVCDACARLPYPEKRLEADHVGI